MEFYFSSARKVLVNELEIIVEFKQVRTFSKDVELLQFKFILLYVLLFFFNRTFKANLSPRLMKIKSILGDMNWKDFVVQMSSR